VTTFTDPESGLACPRARVNVPSKVTCAHIYEMRTVELYGREDHEALVVLGALLMDRALVLLHLHIRQLVSDPEPLGPTAAHTYSPTGV
jgi:hypothetical protein